MQAAKNGQRQMGRLIKLILFLVLAGAAVVLGYAIFSELPAPTEDVVVPIPVPE